MATNHKEPRCFPKSPLQYLPQTCRKEGLFFWNSFTEIRLKSFFGNDYCLLLSQSCTSASELISDKMVVACVLRSWKHIGMCVETGITNCRKSTYLKTWQLEPNMQNQTQWKSRGPILLSTGDWPTKRPVTRAQNIPANSSWVWEYTAGTPSIRKLKYGQRKGNRKVGTNTRM